MRGLIVTKYDFSKPSKFAKNHIAGFRNIFEYFCKTSSIILETMLRQEVIVEIENSEENILPSGFKLLDDRTYGRNRLLFCKKVK